MIKLKTKVNKDFKDLQDPGIEPGSPASVGGFFTN